MSFRAKAIALGTGIAAVCTVPLVISVTADAAPDVLLSKGRPVVASTVTDAAHDAAKAVDGFANTSWAAALGPASQWLIVDLGQTQDVTRVRLHWAGGYAKAYRIQVSDDVSAWRDLYATTDGDGGTDDLKKLAGAEPLPAGARHPAGHPAGLLALRGADLRPRPGRAGHQDDGRRIRSRGTARRGAA
nr:hypothetical protein GCM10020092_013540 [Actinoplanes digitatis]